MLRKLSLFLAPGQVRMERRRHNGKQLARTRLPFLWWNHWSSTSRQVHFVGTPEDADDCMRGWCYWFRPYSRLALRIPAWRKIDSRYRAWNGICHPVPLYRRICAVQNLRNLRHDPLRPDNNGSICCHNQCIYATC